MRNQSAAQYRRRFTFAIGGYIGMLVMSLWLLRRDLSPVVDVIIALLPVAPALFGIWAFTVFLRSLDELQRQIQFQAFGFSLLTTAIVTFTLGFLTNAGLPQIGLIWVLPMIIAFWGMGQWLAGRHYR